MAESETTVDGVVGILGGMGPAATADFYAKLTARTQANSDKEHLKVAIWADPTVPDRVAAILDGSTDPYPQLLAGARNLLAMHATLVVIPCNTAHAFLPRLAADTGLRFIDMIEETVKTVTQQPGRVRSVGLLGTDGTISSRLYQNAFAAHDVQAFAPADHVQRDLVLPAIAQIKAGNQGQAGELIETAIDHLAANGADAVVLACTELPIAYTGPHHVPVIDPTDELAKAVIRAKGRTPH